MVMLQNGNEQILVPIFSNIGIKSVSDQYFLRMNSNYFLIT